MAEQRASGQRFCERCGEPCDNNRLCGTCLAQQSPAERETELETDSTVVESPADSEAELT